MAGERGRPTDRHEWMRQGKLQPRPMLPVEGRGIKTGTPSCGLPHMWDGHDGDLSSSRVDARIRSGGIHDPLDVSFSALYPLMILEIRRIERRSPMPIRRMGAQSIARGNGGQVIMRVLWVVRPRCRQGPRRRAPDPEAADQDATDQDATGRGMTRPDAKCPEVQGPPEPWRRAR